MSDFSKPETVELGEVKERITSSDLVPSRASLLVGIDQMFESFAQFGLRTLRDLQGVLKNQTKMEALAKAATIDTQILVLLRREVESYQPKPFKLVDVEWLPSQDLQKMIDIGIRNSNDLLSVIQEANGVESLESKTGTELTILQELASLSLLTKIQWVNLNFARMLNDAGYGKPQDVASAEGQNLYEDLIRVNVGGKYFNGKIGLRDANRLIHAAKYAQ